jgi:hypothetical protein
MTDNIDKKKQYREDNKEKKKEYLIQYRKDNIEKTSRKMLCECGIEITLKNRDRHLKTTFHSWVINNNLMLSKEVI